MEVLVIAARASTFDDGGVSVSEARLLNKYCTLKNGHQHRRDVMPSASQGQALKNIISHLRSNLFFSSQTFITTILVSSCLITAPVPCLTINTCYSIFPWVNGKCWVCGVLLARNERWRSSYLSWISHPVDTSILCTLPSHDTSIPEPVRPANLAECQRAMRRR